MKAMEQYRKEININKDYKISIKDFLEFLMQNNKIAQFRYDIKHEDMFYVATDYSIPIIMIKFLKRVDF